MDQKYSQLPDVAQVSQKLSPPGRVAQQTGRLKAIAWTATFLTLVLTGLLDPIGFMGGTSNAAASLAGVWLVAALLATVVFMIGYGVAEITEDTGKRQLAEGATQVVSTRDFEVTNLEITATTVIIGVLIDPVQRRIWNGIEIASESCSWGDGLELMCRPRPKIPSILMGLLVRLIGGRRKFLAVQFPNLRYNYALDRQPPTKASFRIMERP